MSNRFNDQLEKIMRGNGRPMGFGQYVSAVKPRLFIVAEAKDPKKEESLTGIDAVFVPGACQCKGEKSGVLRGCTGPAETGCDFIVSELDGAVDADPGEDTARLLNIAADLNDAQLRALGGLDAAAVIAKTDLGETLTFLELLSVQRLADFSGKPVILRLPKLYSKVELQALWHRGIVGVMVNADTVDTAALRKIVDMLEPKKRGQDKSMAIVRQAAAAPAEEADPDTETEPEEDE